MINKNAKIYISGHTGMVGRAVSGLFQKQGYNNLIFRTSQELDLRNQEKVERFMKEESPEYVFLFAAKVGGIKANSDFPAQFIYVNLMIEANVIHAAYKYKVKKLLFLASSCAYPRECPQPMKEEYLLTGKLEPTNEGYAIAKIAGIKLCECYNKEFSTNFIVLIPPNLYGPNDNFDLNTSHAIPALVRKFVDAKAKGLAEVEVWGTGRVRREFLYAGDAAEASLYFMSNYDAKDLPPFVNIGCERDITIKELVEMIKKETHFKGKVTWNTSMQDGMPRKLLDPTIAKKYGWTPKISLEEGIRKTIQWYRENQQLQKIEANNPGRLKGVK